MADEFEKPDTSHLKLKPKVIVPTDPVSRPDDPERISVESIHRQNLEADEKRKRGEQGLAPAADAAAVPAGFKLTEITPVNPMALAGDPEAIKVPEILQANAVVDQQSGWAGYKEPPKRKSRRTRDFFLLVGTIDFGLLCVMLLVRNPVVAMFGLGGITLTTACFGWIMFFVMDDY